MKMTDITFGHQILGGIDIIESRLAVRRVEDWSNVRSPSRAARRLKRGFRQNILVSDHPAAFQVGHQMIVHPSILAEMRHRLAKRVDDDLNQRMMYGSI